MKKYLKFTLFKKVFLIIFCGLLCVESIHIYLDYYAEVIRVVNAYLRENNSNHINDLLFNKYQNEISSKFLEDYDKYYEGSYGYHAIINKDNDHIEFIHEKTYENTRFINSYFCVYNSEYKFSLNKDEFDKDVIEQLTQYIYESYYQDRQQPIYIGISFPSKESKNQTPTIIIPNSKLKNKTFESSNEEVYKYIIETYDSKDFSYTCYSSDGYPQLIDYKKENENARNLVIERTKNYGHYNTNTSIYYEFIDNQLYVINGVFNSTINYIDVYPTRYTSRMLLDNVILSKERVYVFALILTLLMSVFISYMITKRIKKIDKTAKLIANNEFDLKLKENPKDELGDLSHSINLMSEQLKNTIAQLNLEIEHVKELESLRKDFINQFTHEMKTPLGIINGYSELLDEVETDEERDKYIHVINRETEKINQLIISMLNLSRLESKNVELNIEEVDLEDLVTEVVDEYEVLLMKKDIRVRIETLNEKIMGDCELLKTVIHNFISNAIKHVYEGGEIHIVINQGCYVFNEGKHISEENISQIWHTFVTHDQQGSGLGLAICASILDLHGYKYGVMNKENGVEFYFERK